MSILVHLNDFSTTFLTKLHYLTQIDRRFINTGTNWSCCELTVSLFSVWCSRLMIQRCRIIAMETWSFFLCFSNSAESKFQFSVSVSLVTHLTDEDTSSHSDIPDTLSTLSDGDNNAPWLQCDRNVFNTNSPRHPSAPPLENRTSWLASSLIWASDPTWASSFTVWNINYEHSSDTQRQETLPELFFRQNQDRFWTGSIFSCTSSSRSSRSRRRTLDTHNSSTSLCWQHNLNESWSHDPLEPTALSE